LLLTVDDNGPGMPPDFELEGSSGFGLASTQARLASLYGGGAHLTLLRRFPSGTRAELVVPSESKGRDSGA
jgi:signal transduction histidine kinase